MLIYKYQSGGALPNSNAFKIAQAQAEIKRHQEEIARLQTLIAGYRERQADEASNPNSPMYQAEQARQELPQRDMPQTYEEIVGELPRRDMPQLRDPRQTQIRNRDTMMRPAQTEAEQEYFDEMRRQRAQEEMRRLAEKPRITTRMEERFIPRDMPRIQQKIEERFIPRTEVPDSLDSERMRELLRQYDSLNLNKFLK